MGGAAGDGAGAGGGGGAVARDGLLKNCVKLPSDKGLLWAFTTASPDMPAASGLFVWRNVLPCSLSYTNPPLFDMLRRDVLAFDQAALAVFRPRGCPSLGGGSEEYRHSSGFSLLLET